jgi:hypothetical protein
MVRTDVGDLLFRGRALKSAPTSEAEIDALKG